MKTLRQKITEAGGEVLDSDGPRFYVTAPLDNVGPVFNVLVKWANHAGDKDLMATTGVSKVKKHRWYVVPGNPYDLVDF